MAAREAGLRFLKFFPAEQSGGIASLKAFASPLADVKFCPTGGITGKNAADYLSLPNVICVGGSWVAPDDLVKAGKWDEIEALARAIFLAQESVRSNLGGRLAPAHGLEPRFAPSKGTHSVANSAARSIQG